MPNIDLNMTLGPEFTLLVVDQSGNSENQPITLLVESDDLQIGIEDSSSPLSIQMDNKTQIMTLGVGIRYSDTSNTVSIPLPTGGLTGQVLQKVSDTTGDYAWVDADLSGGSDFLPVPDMIDESNETYFYFGWISLDGNWLIQRQERLSSLTLKAVANNNSSILFNDAWTNRLTISYI